MTEKPNGHIFEQTESIDRDSYEPAYSQLANILRRSMAAGLLRPGDQLPSEAQLCERIVQGTNIEWTIVRASWFNQNFSEGEFLEMVLAGAVTLPAGNIPEPFVDADDIADVAVAALTEKGHAGQIYELTGPRLLTFNEAVAEIVRASRREIQYIQIPHDTFAAGIAQSGAPEDMAWLLDYLFSTVLDGRNAHVCDGVQRALGRDPTDFSEYARRAADSGVWEVSLSTKTG